MVHASLRKLGPIERGAAGLLDALIEVLGPHGTLLEAGHARTGPVGSCNAELFAVQTFADFAVTWMEARFGV